jgi:hypothetical protein
MLACDTFGVGQRQGVRPGDVSRLAPQGKRAACRQLRLALASAMQARGRRAADTTRLAHEGWASDPHDGRATVPRMRLGCAAAAAARRDGTEGRPRLSPAPRGGDGVYPRSRPDPSTRRRRRHRWGVAAGVAATGRRAPSPADSRVPDRAKP